MKKTIKLIILLPLIILALPLLLFFTIRTVLHKNNEELTKAFYNYVEEVKRIKSK